MKIAHVAIWVENLEKMKTFYCRHFKMKAGDIYYNPKKGFTSYFLYPSEGPGIELMHQENIYLSNKPHQFGLAHLALSVGSEEQVNEITESLKAHSVRIESEPRTTGDGYYESVIVDPEGNLIEITI